MVEAISTVAVPAKSKSGGKAAFKEESGFAGETREAFGKLRTALGELVGSVPGDLKRPRDLQRALGVDYKICWQVFQVVRASDELGAVKHAPSAPALKRVLAAAEGMGVSSGVTAAVKAAAEKLGDVVSNHAEDRGSFEGMVAGLTTSEEVAAGIELQNRRAAYRALSQIWGVQTDTYCLGTFARLSESGKGTDECVVNHKRGMRRLRPNSPMVVHGYRHHTAAGNVSGPSRVPLVPKVGDGPALLLPAFCSRPLPPLQDVVYPNGWVWTEVVGDAIGRESALDVTLAGVAREVPFSVDKDGRRLLRTSVTIKTSVGMLITDFYIHRPSFGEVRPEVMMFENTQGDESPEVARRAPQLPVREKLVKLGSGLAKSHTTESPRFLDAMRFACDALGWDPEEFDAYRLRVEYPVLNSVVRVQFYMD